ncbi:MAG: electron transport complex subunit RsxE [Candidatus Latescibacteria bacterium]|jgi:Na+-transporting NADH:ubiquinone oxidoreductase subunit D|nr:electron transport complex subunit RsxE [Candidatus Latescibacterota bacterium]
MGLRQTREWRIFYEGFWTNNASFRMMLGLCSTLAVTNSVRNSIAMSFGVIFVLISSSTIISLMRAIIPARVRMAVFMMVISTFTIVVDQILKAYYPDVSESLGPYVGLIITNCIVMGRAEAFAISNPVFPSIIDALAVATGYAFSLVLLATVRELLGFGTFFGFTVLGTWWTPWVIMILPPGAFFVLGLYIWLLRSISKEES